MPKKPRKRVNLTIDQDVWTRCQYMSSQFDFINWSSVAQTAFEQILVLLDETLEALSEGETSEDAMQRAILRFQVQYHASLSHAYKTLREARSDSSLTNTQ
jgi:hypothetical protein